ncbi:DUF5074 domain-containing protein [Sunxiuqinia sp. A32]|uniref:DUF5074 domain-containing protein n=1 Tax=Sunxiuqinia sp. A32 TaxID=3461496 RepID=UPI00404530D1
MKKFLKYFTILFFALAVLSSCNEEDPEPNPYSSEFIKGCYVINFGNYDAGGASISKYDYDADALTNLYYQNQNPGFELLSNVQYAYKKDEQIFLLGNAPDQLITVDPLFVQTLNGVTDQIEKPRACIANGDYLYISCWGENADWDVMPDSYIAKYNLKTSTVEEKIDLPGGPEGVEIANGKLYAALNFRDSVAVINLDDQAVSYIVTPAVSSYFLKDKTGNLYVSLLNTYTKPSNDTGLGYINTATDELETVYPLSGISTEYASIMAANSDFSKIYVTAASYVQDQEGNWNLSGAISEFDVAGKTFGAEPLISNISGAKGVTVNPVNDNIYVFVAESVVGAGLMKIYDTTGELLDQKTVGASPTMAVFQN